MAPFHSIKVMVAKRQMYTHTAHSKDAWRSCKMLLLLSAKQQHHHHPHHPVTITTTKSYSTTSYKQAMQKRQDSKVCSQTLQRHWRSPFLTMVLHCQAAFCIFIEKSECVCVRVHNSKAEDAETGHLVRNIMYMWNQMKKGFCQLSTLRIKLFSCSSSSSSSLLCCLFLHTHTSLFTLHTRQQWNRHAYIKLHYLYTHQESVSLAPFCAGIISTFKFHIVLSHKKLSVARRGGIQKNLQNALRTL